MGGSFHDLDRKLADYFADDDRATDVVPIFAARRRLRCPPARKV